jgi:hypothetical protein
MSELSRRNLLRASAGAAAIAVPMAALAGPRVASGGSHIAEAELNSVETAAFGGGRVLFSVRDAATGEVAIYHGTDEVIVHDRALVARIVRAANAAHVS